MLSPILAQQLKKVEGFETKLTQVGIEATAVLEHHAAQMTRYLSLRSEGNARTMVKASIVRNEHHLETLRSLSREYDPNV